MGEFARGIHFYKKDKKHIMQAVSMSLQTRNYAQCESNEFDRAVAIIESNDWISVFDSDVFDDAFNKTISLNIDAHGVSFDLIDGDCLQAILWRNGQRVNTFISDPECVGLKRTKSNCGNAKKWGAVTQEMSALQSIFESTMPFATRCLFEISKVLAIPDQVALMQYEHLDAFDLVDISYVYFHDATPKLLVPDVPVFKWTGGQLPMLRNRTYEAEECYPAPPKAIFYVGDEFSAITFFTNEGKAANGMTISIVGDCLQSGSIAFERIQLFDGCAEKNKLIAEVSLNRVVFQDGRIGYNATFDDVEIPRSISFAEYSRVAGANHSKKKDFKQFTLKVFGNIVGKPNISRATIFTHPNENYTEGCFQADLFNDDFVVL